MLRCVHCHSTKHLSSACYRNPANRAQRAKFVAYRVQESARGERKLIVVALDPLDPEHAIQQTEEIEKMLESTFATVERVDFVEHLHTFSSLGRLRKATDFWREEKTKRVPIVDRAIVRH